MSGEGTKKRKGHEMGICLACFKKKEVSVIGAK